ncbi:MAG: hypothetical protein GY946_33150 [bacterium]|nr:hypothetical protein [bacterium]
MAVDEITHVTLSPSHTVALGTTVTVMVHGTGTCTVWVETNGASPIDGGTFGDYQVGPGGFPMTVSFVAHEVGTFKIAAIGADANGELCVEGGDFGKNTTLAVLHPADPEWFGDKFHPIPKPRPWTGPGPMRFDRARPQLQPGSLPEGPVSAPAPRVRLEPRARSGNQAASSQPKRGLAVEPPAAHGDAMRNSPRVVHVRNTDG